MGSAPSGLTTRSDPKSKTI
ncbi:hypothetical protein BN1723_018639, partial [Verticillium longisporum]